MDKRRKGELNLQLGDRVWLPTANLKLACPSKKLAPRFVGPLQVKRRLNEVLYELGLTDSFKIHPVFHVSLLKPAIPDPFPERRSGPPEPILINGDKEYEVEAILDCRKRQNRVQYLIKWKGYSPEDNSWEPECNVHARGLIRAFFHAHPGKEGQLGIQRLPLGRGQCQGHGMHRRALACAHLAGK